MAWKLPNKWLTNAICILFARYWLQNGANNQQFQFHFTTWSAQEFLNVTIRSWLATYWSEIKRIKYQILQWNSQRCAFFNLVFALRLGKMKNLKIKTNYNEVLSHKKDWYQIFVVARVQLLFLLEILLKKCKYPSHFRSNSPLWIGFQSVCFH